MLTSLHSYFLSLPLFAFSPPPRHLLRTCFFLDSSMSMLASPWESSLNRTSPHISFSPLACLFRMLKQDIHTHCVSSDPAVWPVSVPSSLPKLPFWLISPVVCSWRERLIRLNFLAISCLLGQSLFLFFLSQFDYRRHFFHFIFFSLHFSYIFLHLLPPDSSLTWSSTPFGSTLNIDFLPDRISSYFISYIFIDNL